MTVTFLREARSSAARRSSRRSRPAARETPVEAKRERVAGRGIVATPVILTDLLRPRSADRWEHRFGTLLTADPPRSHET